MFDGAFCLFKTAPLSSKMLGYFHYQIKIEPMENHEIQTVLMNALSLQEVHVSGDGSHFQVIAVGEMFDGMSRVKKQQSIYAPLMEYIADNRIHALSIKAFTPQEWARDRKLNGF
ncbi:acid stress-induced BolA-like protein IbaG/YrbA [Raoultella sp. BIGb0138]|nr:acid stress-induced BolA-like protein IbaG/YrbA [Raoultella sp. BIGb0138]